MRVRPRIARVVVPAFRAIATIKECAGAIACSRANAAIEIVVVDDGENPGLDQPLSDLPVTIKRTGGSGGAAVARNLGAADFSSGVLLSHRRRRPGAPCHASIAALANPRRQGGRRCRQLLPGRER